MTDPAPPPGLPAQVAEDWVALGRATPASEPYTADGTDNLPEPVRRWLRWALPAGTPVRRSAELRMRGQIRIGRWAPFTAVQRMSVGGGFVWAATARPFGVPVVGFDRWTRGTGEMAWRLFGRIPFISGRGEDVRRSAAGRHAGELLLACPSAALCPEVTWRPVDAVRATATLRIGGASHEVTLTVGDDGAPTALAMTRWGPVSGGFAEQPFGAELAGACDTADGARIPRRVVAGWGFGTERWPEGCFIRWTVDRAELR